VSEIVAMAHATDVDRSIAFHALLGFRFESRVSGPDSVTSWTDLRSGAARLVLARASGAMRAADESAPFWLYTRELRAVRAHWSSSGPVDAGPPPEQEGSTAGARAAPGRESRLARARARG